MCVTLFVGADLTEAHSHTYMRQPKHGVFSAYDDHTVYLQKARGIASVYSLPLLITCEHTRGSLRVCLMFFSLCSSLLLLKKSVADAHAAFVFSILSRPCLCLRLKHP